jgi:uncharacterized protein YdhG (YjbR/CyaY superfamily)
MSLDEVNAYLDALPEPKKSTMLEVRKAILEIEPRLDQVFAWRSPMFKLDGKFVAGICAHKNHLTYSPQSKDVMEQLAKELDGFVVSGSSFQFAVDQALPKELLKKLIAGRLSEIE